MLQPYKSIKFKESTKKPLKRKKEAVKTVEPSIYVASLSDYNSGRLEGTWLNLTDFRSGRDVLKAIEKFLQDLSKKKKDGEIREEYAIHDYEGFPESMYTEWMGVKEFDNIIDYWNAIEDLPFPAEILSEVMSSTGYRGDDVTDFAERAADAYLGEFDKKEDWAYDFVENIGEIPNPEYYVETTPVDAREWAQQATNYRYDDLKSEGYDDREIEDIVEEEADDIEKQLKDDPWEYLTKDQGISKKDLMQYLNGKAGGRVWYPIRFDAEAFVRDEEINGSVDFIRGNGVFHAFDPSAL